MADLEERVTVLEREVTALKTRVGENEEDLSSIPDLIKLEFRLGNSQLARLSRDVAELKGEMRALVGDVGQLKDDVRPLKAGQFELAAKVEALPRIIAEMVTETFAEREKKG